MPRKSMLIAGAALAAAVAAGGSAYTASNTVNPGTLGYGTSAVTGATVNSIAYTTNAAGDTINSVSLVLAGDTHTSNVSIGFNGGPTTTCGTGTYTSPSTSYTCDVSSLAQSTSGLNQTAVLVN